MFVFNLPEKQSQELTSDPGRNIFLINVELTATFFTLQGFGPSPSRNLKKKKHFNFYQPLTLITTFMSYNNPFTTQFT